MKKITALILALLMLAGLLVSCTTEPDTTVTDPSTDPATTPATDPATEPETEPETEPDTTVRIGETPLSEYTVVYGEGYEATAAELAARFEAICGTALAVKPEAEATGDKEIAVFASSLGASADGLGMDDFKIVQNGTSFVISGGSTYATDTACAKLLDVFVADKYTYDYSEVAITYTLPDRQEYINDFSKLAFHWEFYFETPEWMLDFDEKYAAFLDVDGRLMSCFHRGEMVYYPENSIEGFISAVMMGADMVELDPRVTKDGVFVLLHDSTLWRTTDVAEKMGKNGLPNSAELTDWTYEQLQQLNLKMGQGGDGAVVTPYKIPTLDEAIKVCANNLFVRLDVKEDANGNVFWQFDRDIWPLLEKYNAYTTVICTWQSAFASSGYKLTRELRERTEAICGKPILNFMKNANDGKKLTREIAAYNLCYAMRLTCNFSGYSYKTFLQDQAKQLASCKGIIRVYADVHNTNPAYPENCESPEFFMELYDAGINLQLTNHGFMMVKLIAEQFTATEYTN